MEIIVNGCAKDVRSSLTLAELLKQLEVNANTVVVERNKSVVSREDLSSIQVEKDDRIEIVQFVGGGSGEPESSDTSTPKEAVSEEAHPVKESDADSSKNGEEAPKKSVKKKSAKKKAAKKKAKRKKASKKKSAKKVNGPKNLVIVESPAKAKTINKFLGKDFQVEASFGHVRDLPRSKMGVDIENDFEPHYIVIRKASKTVKNLRAQAKGKEKIFLAPDPDREGEAISWHLGHIFREKDEAVEINRVVFNEITKDAVTAAFEQSRTLNMSLVDAQQARRILDRLVGYELSPLLWAKVGKGLSAGRVQSVALRLIVEREREIKEFVPVEYWSLEAKLSSEKEENKGNIFLAKLEKINGEKAELKNQEQTDNIREEVLESEFIVKKIEKRKRSRKPQAPYTTSKLQQEAYNRLGYPAAKTMRIAQKLYEGVEIGNEGSVGLITYMRTDSVNIAESAQKETAEFIKTKYGAEYLPEKPPVYKAKKGAQEAHEAIRPTSVLRTPDEMEPYVDADALKLYHLIWSKFVGSQMMPAIDEQISILIDVKDKYTFKTTGRRNIFPGFGLVFGDSSKAKEKEKAANGEAVEKEAVSDELPVLEEGEKLTLNELLGHQHFTKPPGRFNDASLVKILEEKGIGRPSTYAPTIYTLLYREYVERQGGALLPTELGFIISDLLVEHFPRVLDVEFTATMEEELDKIEEGNMEWKKVIRDFYAPFSENVGKAKEKMKNFRREVVVTDYKCETCDKNLVEKWGRFGKFLACSGFPDCKFTRSLPTGFTCPEEGCGGDLVKRKSKKNRTFYGCSNYPKCNHITNKLPKKDDEMGDDEKLSDTDQGATAV